MVNKGKIPKGRITLKKARRGYLINVNGKLFDEVTDKVSARVAVKRIQRLRNEDKRRKR